MAKVVKNNLGYLGVDFQYKLISAFMEDQGFFRDLEKIIDQNMFTESYLRTIVGVLKEYFDKHSYLPSYEMLEIKLNDISYTEDEQQFYKETIQTLKKQPSFERDEIEQLAEKFFIQQNWIRVSNEIKRIAGDGDISKYDELMDLVEKANSVGKRNLEFFNPYDDMEKNLTPSSTTFIPTGIEKLDNTLGGGLEKGKLGAIIAPSGVGKALADDEIVMTPNGPKMIKEIKVGDNVIGLKELVTNLFENGFEPGDVNWGFVSYIGGSGSVRGDVLFNEWIAIKDEMIITEVMPNGEKFFEIECNLSRCETFEKIKKVICSKEKVLEALKNNKKSKLSKEGKKKQETNKQRLRIERGLKNVNKNKKDKSEDYDEYTSDLIRFVANISVGNDEDSELDRELWRAGYENLVLNRIVNDAETAEELADIFRGNVK